MSIDPSLPETAAHALHWHPDDLSVGVIKVDHAGLCVSANRAFCTMTGLESKKQLGKPWWQAVHKEDQKRIALCWSELVTQHRQLCTEFRVSKPDGTVVWMYAQCRIPGEKAESAAFRTVSFTDITVLKEAEKQIAQFAFYDALTGLPNRRLLMDRLSQVVKAQERSNKSGALLFLDLDNFKSLNDTMGHDKGDLLLQHVAARLKSAVRVGDTVARLGGDEFVAVLENLSPRMRDAARQVRSVAEKILAELNERYELDDLEHFSTPSIGITMFGPASVSVEELMKRADMAMYQAKSAGRNTFRFFDPEMQAVIAARVELENELRTALQEDQFILHYQPKFNSEGGLVGAEAFVRWEHPTRGLVSPASFIPLAEETGLIVPLGNFVLKQACVQLQQWGESPETSQLIMEVKLSGLQLHQSDFVQMVLETLKTTGARPDLLKLEINESLLVLDVEDIIEKTTELSDYGIVFSLADLGTGYSSLSHLRRLALDQLRIDQSFVRGLLTDSNDAAVTRSIFALASSLKLKVGAEGVETQEQRDLLASHGCVEFQGYFFSQPLHVSEFEDLVRRQTNLESVA